MKFKIKEFLRNSTAQEKFILTYKKIILSKLFTHIKLMEIAMVIFFWNDSTFCLFFESKLKNKSLQERLDKAYTNSKWK